MSEVLLPTWIIPDEETQEWLDEGSVVFPSAFAPGIAQRQSYGGLRLKMSRRHTVRGEEKAQLLSILNQTRGRYNVLRTKVHFALRGSGFGTEIQSNPSFADGTTGWASNNTGASTIAVADRVLRTTRVANAGTPTIAGPSSTAVLYAPYVGRAYVRAGRGSLLWDIRIRDTSDAAAYATSTSNRTTEGYDVCSGVPYDTDVRFGLIDRAGSKTAGDFMDLWWSSIARCALVDNGLNSLLQSDEFDTSWTATRASVDDQDPGVTDPIGTNTADEIIEDATASNTHLVSQNVTVSSTALDYSFACVLRAGARTWGRLSIVESVSSHELVAYFDLGNGAVGTTVTVTGANWTNARAFIQSLGNSWYYCVVVGRKASAATTLTARIGLATGDGTQTYTGDGTSSIYAWRATLVQSSVPTRLIQTTTTESTGTSQTGTAVHVKGLPASTSGLLLPGDYFEIGGEIKQCTAPLNSDAAGLGYLQFEPALVRSPANDDPVIVTDPMGKFLVSNIKVDNRFGQHAVVTYDLEHIYE
jgi:hypothetical protein